MKRAMLLGCLLCAGFFSMAAIIKWDGEGGDGLWSTAINWVGDMLPGNADDVVLDNEFVPGEYEINLPGGNADVILNSLIIAPSNDQHIALILPTTNTSGTAFLAKGPGDAVVLNKGAVFINASGAASGTPISVMTDNFFRINNGGRYIHRTERGHTTNLASRLSMAPGTEYGIFEFDVPASSFTVSLTGRTYGSLIFSAARHGSPVIYSGNGVMTLRINGDLLINEGATLSNGMSADIMIKHDLRVRSGAIFNLQNNSASNIVKLEGSLYIQGLLTETNTGSPVLELNGIGNQDIYVEGAVMNNIIVRINNSAGVTLLSSLLIRYQLQLQLGKIRSSAAATLVLADNALYTGGSTESFIEGPMKKGGDDEQFIFPVGKGEIYAPIGFHSPGISINDTLQAEYVRSNPQSQYGASYEPGIDHISYVEYWRLEKVSGSVMPMSIMLTATPYSFTRDLNTLFVAGYNSTDRRWRPYGRSIISPGAPSPPYVTGTITSDPLMMTGAFTLGTDEPFADNPLPVSLIYFTATRSTGQSVSVDWELAECCTPPLLFEIQRAGANKSFVGVTTLESRDKQRVYSVSNITDATAISYYRLKITDANGDSVFSKIVLVRGDQVRDWSINFSPAIASNSASLTIHAPGEDGLTLLVSDMQGRTVKVFRQQVSAGITNVYLDLHGLLNGTYILTGVTGKGIRLKGVKFILRNRF